MGLLFTVWASCCPVYGQFEEFLSLCDFYQFSNRINSLQVWSLRFCPWLCLLLAGWLWAGSSSLQGRVHLWVSLLWFGNLGEPCLAPSCLLLWVCWIRLAVRTVLTSFLATWPTCSARLSPHQCPRRPPHAWGCRGRLLVSVRNCSTATCVE